MPPPPRRPQPVISIAAKKKAISIAAFSADDGREVGHAVGGYPLTSGGALAVGAGDGAPGAA